MGTETVKGFNDYLGAEALKREKVKRIIQKQFELYGFEPAETPTIEYEEFVKGDNQNDEAISDVFTLQDKGERKLALKYESTFQLKRISKNQKLPYKRYQIARVFRDEPVKMGRVREFTQCDADVLGSSLKDEAELLSMASRILKELKIDFEIEVNNRRLLNEILEEEKIPEKNREAVIRIVDKLDKLPVEEVAKELAQFKAEKILKIFQKPEKEFEKFAYFKQIKELISLCKLYDVKLKFSPTLARGLSYYNGTIFEIKGKKEVGTICGGGAYEINKIQAFGFAFGLERLSMLTKVEGETTKILIISLNDDKRAIDLAEKLREKEITTQVLFDKAVGKALDYANSKNIKTAIIVGEKDAPKFVFKDLDSGKESLLSDKEIMKLLNDVI